MKTSQLRKYSLEIVLLISALITVFSFMMMSSQGSIEQNQKFIEYVSEYSKVDLYLFSLIKCMDYSDAVYTEGVRYYVRVTDEKLVESFDGQTFTGNTVVISKKSYDLDFKIKDPKVYIDPDLIENNGGYGIVIGDIVYNAGGYKGTGRGAFVVYLELSKGALNINFKYGKLALPSLKTSVYIVYLEDKGVFRGYDNPSKISQLFTSEGELIDPVSKSVIDLEGV